MDDNTQNPQSDPNDQTSNDKEQLARSLVQVVCICKGINLGKILKVLPQCETVQDVNQKAGTGTGGCQGQRCGPRIKLLLKKMAEARQRR